MKDKTAIGLLSVVIAFMAIIYANSKEPDENLYIKHEPIKSTAHLVRQTDKILEEISITSSTKEIPLVTTTITTSVSTTTNVTTTEESVETSVISNETENQVTEEVITSEVIEETTVNSVETSTELCTSETEQIETSMTETEYSEIVTTINQQDDNQEKLDNILSAIKYEKELYPYIKIAVGVYNYPDFEPIFEYNKNLELSAGCTVKAAYALYVLKTCEKESIDIYSTYLTYDAYNHWNGGSGDIKYSADGTQYTISTLITKLLGISDNTAYNILLSRFELNDFQDYLKTIDGQNLYQCRYGIASVIQRKNEWKAILEYCSSDSKYSDFLASAVSNTEYCYIAQGLSEDYPYMHKSGWADGNDYTCAADCAVVNNTVIIIITSDYSTGEGHVDSVRRIAGSIEPLI